MGVLWDLLAIEALKRRHWVPVTCVGDCFCRQVCSVSAECLQVLKSSNFKPHTAHASLSRLILRLASCCLQPRLPSAVTGITLKPPVPLATNGLLKCLLADNLYAPHPNKAQDGGRILSVAQEGEEGLASVVGCFTWTKPFLLSC